MTSGRMSRVIPHLRRAALGHDGAGLPDAELLTGYVARRDEEAFAVLVRRHGPMVFGVCRRVLGNTADAEDAFQATFLVLVRKAAAVVPRSQVGNWLYGVAINTARKAKAMTRNRRIKERQAATRPRSEEAPDDWQELQAQLDEQLSRLPDKYRVPIVLCDLEGKPVKAAAKQLGWPQGTVASRLSRGRALLARRLKRGGVLLSSGALAAVLTERATSASVPSSLVSSTMKAAALFAAGQTATGTISVPVVALTEGVLKAMLMTKLKIVAGLILMVVAGVAIAGAAGVSFWTKPLEGTATAQQPLTPYQPPLVGQSQLPGKGAGSTLPSEDPKQTERDTVEQLRRALHREQKAVAEPLALPVGRWNIERSNGEKEVCEIRKDGAASIAEGARKSDGKAAVKESVIIIVFRDDQVERWTPVGHKMVVEHWATAADYPSVRPVLGIGERLAVGASFTDSANPAMGVQAK
jgi:RNA polymerase sigma factor (sigma-70 family)